jgi:sugar lactone lactonase YvrE
MEFTEVATGYVLLEGPRAEGDAVWFGDPILGGLYRLNANGKVDTFAQEMKRIAGACLNADGAIVCSAAGGVAWFNPNTGKSGMVVDGIDGKPILGANDIFPDGKGGLYFGTMSLTSENAGEPPKPTQLYRVDPNGKVTLLWDDLHIANGIGLSPDGGRLYVNESWRATFVYDVAADGSLGNRRQFSAQTDCDGLAVDVEGGVWIACVESGAIIRVLPDGKLDRRISCPVKNVTSLCFGGRDGRDVYLATGGNVGLEMLMQGKVPPRTASLYKGRADVAGLPTPVTRFTL